MQVSFSKLNYKETFPLRKSVMDPDKPLDQMKRPGDEDGLHFGILVDDQLIGVMSLYNQNQHEEFEEGYWRIRGMAIRNDLQGQGFGGRLFDFAISDLPPVKVLWCNSREHAVEFYIKNEMELTHSYETGDPAHPMRYRLVKHFDD